MIKFIFDIAGLFPFPYGIYFVVAVFALVVWFLVAGMLVDWVNDWFAKTFRRK